MPVSSRRSGARDRKGRRPARRSRSPLPMATRAPALVLLLSTVPMLASAEEPQLRETVEHYEIAGKNARQLRDAMDRFGPSANGERFDARTDWRVGSSGRFQPTDAACELAELSVVVEVTTILPRWIDESEASKRLGERWARYMAALELHEDGHKEIGVEAAKEVMERIREIPPQRTCTALQEVIELATAGVVAEYRAREVTYDRQTEHGKSQGAIFP